MVCLEVGLLILLNETSEKLALLALHVTTIARFSAYEKPKGCRVWSCRGVWDGLSFLLDSV